MAQTRETALITGASAGIGREFARVFAKNEFDVVLVARRKEKLEELADELEEDYNIRAEVIATDLSWPGSAEALFAEVTKMGIEVDVLVNNAGVAITEFFHESAFEDQMGLIQLNVVSLAALTHLFLQPMVARGKGRVLNVASVVSFVPTPSFAAYGASKAFVLSLSESLSEELRDTGVTVTALCPGYTETDMISGAFQQAGSQDLENYVPSFIKLDAATVAEEGFKACMKGKAVHVDRWTNDLAAQWVRHQPKWLVRRAGGFFARLMR